MTHSQRLIANMIAESLGQPVWRTIPEAVDFEARVKALVAKYTAQVEAASPKTQATVRPPAMVG